VIAELTTLRLNTIGRDVYIRPGTHDGFTFTDNEELYHIPPRWMPPPATVLDLGANIGLVALHYRAMWPEAEMLCVEMDAGNCELFRRNAPDLSLLHAAVSDHAGKGTYDGSEETNRYALGGGDTGVELITIPALALKLDGRIDFCKVDIEGGEWRLLDVVETWAPLVEHFLVELHSGGKWQDAFARLTDAGYDVCRSWIHSTALFAWKPS
jgi:FkbM family methyltransferase